MINKLTSCSGQYEIRIVVFDYWIVVKQEVLCYVFGINLIEIDTQSYSYISSSYYFYHRIDSSAEDIFISITNQKIFFEVISVESVCVTDLVIS